MMNHRRHGLVALSILVLSVPACAVAADGEESDARSQSQPWLVPTGPIPTVTVEPAPPLGWPHEMRTAEPVDCATEPGPDEVVIASDTNFEGSCALLKPGFYLTPLYVRIGLATSSIKVGSRARARAFKGTVFSKSWTIFPPGSRNNLLYNFNDEIYSFRIEPGDRSMICDDLRDGEIALFENSSFQGDCVVLPGNESYPSAEHMGIENDSISSIRNNSARKLIGFWDTGFSQSGFTVNPYSTASSLPSGGTWTDGINDDISSIQMVIP